MLEELLKKAGLIDVVIVVIAALAIVGFWRGVWNLIDYYVFPEQFILSQVVTIVFGILILWVLSLYRGRK